MSSHNHTMSCSSSSSFDEYQWVINIGRALEKELEDGDDQDPVSIFTVPRTLMSSRPDSYTPQQLSLGPYHYLSPRSSRDGVVQDIGGQETANSAFSATTLRISSSN
ncbi:PROTEIN putative (DUF247)-RELATED-RELATED [Salix purpurea]|uniref:PROTEIN putative (DUF247)-RELATED-RELATED n=1 Tax=Salix purpurea TaxID=77065 RepID=A0A9Q0TGU5_SALPP|nr:PROTEIN putative (DUF247)-RELATED-RELATED [Salix purpurea]